MPNVAIIGGGASGLIAAIVAAQNGAKVTLFESNSSVGKKILASGNGRCNIVNTSLHQDNFHGFSPNFMQTLLHKVMYNDIQQLFESLGLMFNVLDDGRCYPLSNEAKSVVIALENSARSLGVEILLNHYVSTITKPHSFRVEANQKHFDFDKVLIATGLGAAPQLGSNESGLALAHAFGHTTLPTFPSLVQLHLNESSLTQKIAGLRVQASVTLYIDGEKCARKTGDTLFTKYGLSGLTVLDLSYEASYALLMGQSVVVSLQLVDFTRKQLLEKLSQLFSLRNQAISDALSGMIAYKLARVLVQLLDLENVTTHNVQSSDIKKIANYLLDWRFNVNETHGFKHAEVSGGGVLCDEIDPDSFESTLIKGLFFSGEVLDIVGDRGGYNFYFAWASGLVAGKALAT